MDVRHGFIVGIFNYCDRWCDACAFTSRCRLFADRAEAEASRDPSLKALVEAPPLEPPSPPPRWLAELLEEIDEAIREPATGEESLELPLPPEHLLVEAMAHDYGMRVYRWSQERELEAQRDPADPVAVILWFHTLVPAKIHRALRGLVEDSPEDRDWPADYDGSAKVALIGIERSHAAWRALAERFMATDAEAARFISDLVWLGEALERAFPNARSFVRPGLDEPDEVSKLVARERAG